MDRTLILFDLDAAFDCTDIHRVLKRHGFNNIQGTAYLSEPGIREAHATLALQEVALRYPRFAQSLSNVVFYSLASEFDASAILESVERARAAFQEQIEHLKTELLQSGLPLEKAEEILSKHTLTLEQ